MRELGIPWLKILDRVWMDGYVRLKEQGTSITGLTVPDDHLHLYAKDNGGVARLYFKDDADVEHELLATGASGVTGTGAAGRVAFWDSATNLTGEAELFWDATNNRLGVGTTTPSSYLEIIGAATDDQLILASSKTASAAKFGGFSGLQYNSSRLAAFNYEVGATTNAIFFGGGIASANAATEIRFYTATGVSGGAGTQRVKIGSDGRTSFGVVTPGSKVHVISESATEKSLILQGAASQSANLQEWQDSSGNALSVLDAAGKLGIANTAPTNRLEIGSSVISAGSSSIAVKQNGGTDGFGTEASGAADAYLLFYHDGTSGKVAVSYNALTGYTPFSFQTGGATRMTIDENGNIAVGAHAPAALLHLSGAGDNRGFVFNNSTVGQTATDGIYMRSSTDGSFWIANQETASTAHIRLFTGDDGGNSWWFTPRHNLVIDSAANEPTTGTKGLIFGDGTALATMASNTAGLYANDVSGTVNMFAINEAGAVTQLSGTSGTYTPTNVTTDRSFDADTVAIAELADVVGTIIADLQARGIFA